MALTDDPRGGGSVDADLLELLSIMPPVIRAMKRPHAAGEGAQPAAVQALLDAGALAPRHLPVIVVLSMQGAMAVSELAQRIGLGVASASVMIGELAKAGVVGRQVDERDRRRTIVSISEPLRADCERLAQERLAPLRRALERMGPETRAHFIAGWRALAAETVGEERAGGACARHERYGGACAGEGRSG